MNVASLLKAKGDEVVTIARQATVRDAAEKLRRKGIGALVVSPDGKRVEGIVSERDIVHALAHRGAELLDRSVSEIMTRTVMTCSPDDSIRQIMWLMTEHRTRHVPVVEDDRLRGIISIGDVVKSRLDELEVEASALRTHHIARR